MRLENDKVEGEEGTEEEEEACKGGEEEGELFERSDEFHDDKGARAWFKTRLDGEVGDDHEAKDHEGGGPHGPGKANLGDEAIDHYAGFSQYVLFRTEKSSRETYGIITPPSDDPEDTIPKASALLLKNHVAIELFAA